jgi:hypothetical protein
MNRGTLFASILTAGLFTVGCNGGMGQAGTAHEEQAFACPALVDSIPIGSSVVPAATILGLNSSTDLAAAVAKQTLVATSFANQQVHSGVFGPDTHSIATNDVSNRATASNTASSTRNNSPIAIVPLTGVVSVDGLSKVDGVATTLPVIGLGNRTDFLSNMLSQTLEHHAIATQDTHSGVFGPDMTSFASNTDFAKTVADTVANATRNNAGIGTVGTDDPSVSTDGVTVPITGVGVNSINSLVNHADQSQFNHSEASHSFQSGVFGPDTSDTALNKVIATANTFFTASEMKNGTPFGVTVGSALAPLGTAALDGLVGVNSALGCPASALDN